MSDDAAIAAALVDRLGGRFSVEAGIDVDAGDREIERWFLLATLFGAPISTAAAMRTFGVLERGGVHTVSDAGGLESSLLIELLDTGGYARYDYRTAERLGDLAAACARVHPTGIAELGRTERDPEALAAALDDLPGWGPVTVAAFLRELRGVWPGARLPLDRKVVGAVRHLDLAGAATGSTPVVEDLFDLARAAGVDGRDLEAALVRMALHHGRRYRRCSGRGPLRCDLLDAGGSTRPVR